MFQQFFNLLQDGQVLKITIIKKGSKLTVATLPDSSLIKDSAKTPLIPRLVSGTPEELNAGFWNEFSNSMPKAMGFISNAEQFSKSVEKAGNDLTKVNDKNGQSSTTKGTSKTDKLIEEAERFEKAGAIPDALSVYRKIYNADKNNKKAADKIRSLEEKLKQGNLFGSNETLQQNENQPISTVIEDDLQSIVEEHNTSQQPFDAFGELTKLGSQTDIHSNTGQNEKQNNQPLDAFAALLQNSNTGQAIPDNALNNSQEANSTSAGQSEVSDVNTPPPGVSPEKWAEFQLFQQMMSKQNSQKVPVNQ